MIRQAYWSMCRAWRRWRRPTDVVLSPHDWVDGLLRHCAPERRDLVVVDGGAHDGAWAQALSRRLSGRFDRVCVHTFEPNRDLIPALHRRLASVPGTRNIAALAARPATLTMNINDSPMTSSLLPRGAAAERYFAHATALREARTVEAVALDDWAARAGVDRIDLLKLDLQGYELEALLGARRLLRATAAVLVEVSFVPLYAGGATFGDVDGFLRAHGFKLYNLYHLSTKTCDGQLNGGDALYVRDPAAAVHHPTRRMREIAA